MRSSARTSDLTFLIVGGVAMLMLTALSFLVAPPDSAPRETGSSYAPSPEGGKAAFLLLQELGHDIDRSFDPFAALQADPSRTLVLLADPTRQPSEQDRAALLRFADAGGIVLGAGASSAGFLPGLTKRDARPGSGEVRSYAPAFPSALSRHVTSIRMTPLSGGMRVDEAVWMPVFAEGGNPGVLTARRGAGRLIWWASSRPLSNTALGEAGHLELLLNAVGPARTRRILWDEYYHGHARSLWSYASGTPVAWGLVQIGLLAAVALFTFGRYVGPPRSRVAVPRTSPLEFIDTMGGLYERARPAGAAVGTARAHVRRRLLACAGLAASSADERLASVLAARFGVDGAAVRSLLERSDVAGRDEATKRDGNITEAEAVVIVQQLQRLAGEVTGPAGRRALPGGGSSGRPT